MPSINTSINKGFSWKTHEHISFKGYAYDQEGDFLTGSDAIALFMHIETAESLSALLRELDGAFTVIIRKHDGVLIGVDTMAMFPVFYTFSENQWLVADDAASLAAQKPGKQLNETVLPEFLAGGFVMGCDTLIRGIYKCRAGEVLFLPNQGKPRHQTYHWFLPPSFTEKDYPVLKKELSAILDKVTERLIRSLDGRPAVIPLSGGYDSRLIACMLKKAGYQNTICFTYGRPNKESELSQRVAEKLGFPWFFTDYRGVYTRTLTEDPEFLAYCDHAGHLSSMPFLQDYFAVRNMREQGILHDDSVFIPGHTGDYVAGSYLEKTIRTNNREKTRAAYLIDKYFKFLLLSKKEKATLTERLNRWFARYSPPETEEVPGYDIYMEDWELKEKFAGFIFNSANVFPFFGYAFRLPLWDKVFREFFRKIPFQYRSYKRLYDEVIQEKYFRPFGVSFADEIGETPRKIKRQKRKKLLRPFIPAFIRKKRMRDRDYLCYHRLTRPMKQDLKIHGTQVRRHINDYNAIITQWYIQEAQKRCDT